MRFKFSRSDATATIFGRKPNNTEDSHRRLGRANGIPRCCTDFWLKDFLKKTNDGRQAWIAHTTAEAKKAGHPLNNRGGLNYVPCPNCTAKRKFVKVHTCNAVGKNGSCSHCGEKQHGLELE